ncbi:MAG: MarR family winged helix-turn-helix transcriptional regulator [Mesorhizobium sp.]
MSAQADRSCPVEAAPTRQAYRLDDQVGFLLRRAQQRHVAIFAASIPDMTPPQFAVLAKLSELGTCPQNQLGNLVAMDAATVKGVIDRLKVRHLVEVCSDESDRRRVLVSLTEQGEATLGGNIENAKNITDRTLKPLTAQEAETFVRLLARLG